MPLVQGTKRPLDNLHIFNKPNNELISINKSVLIALRGVLAWGLQIAEQLEKKRLLGFQIFCFFGPPECLAQALASF